MKYKYIIIGVVILIIVCFAGYVAITEKKISDSKNLFIASLDQITSEANALESIPLQTIYRNGKNWFHLNAGDANFKDGIFYTKEGNLGNGNSATFEEFLKSTELTREQAQVLASIMEKYPYIDGITPDPNISGTCSNIPARSPSCRAIKFYMSPSAFSSGMSTEGFIYIPFTTSDNSKEYMAKHFSSVNPLSENWYQFYGKRGQAQ